MRSTHVPFLALLLLVFSAISAHAYSFRLEIMSATTLDTHSGYVVRSTDFGDPYEEFFMFVEAGKTRVYAIREAGTPWEYLPAGVYIAPAPSVGVNDTWGFFPDDFGNPQIATLDAFVSLTVPGGTFNAFECTARTVGVPGVLNERAHFALGTGLLREYFPADGAIDELASFQVVGGSGYFPLAVGNWWEYELAVSAVDDLPGSLNMLHAAVPNPFNPATAISFEMARGGQARLAIFDVAGRKVLTLFDGPRAAGMHTVTWNGRDGAGRNAPAGVYLYRLEVAGQVQTRAMTLVK